MLAPTLSRPFRRGAVLILLLAFATIARAARVEVDLSGPGWNLWFDHEAAWRNDQLYFPAPPLDQLPVNSPTGGWDSLSARNATAVAVPGTVEEYLQKKPGPEGDLVGVSWWWRTVNLPAVSAERSVLLRFESVRQRAEVFVNRQLVGYDVVGNSPFEVDISRFVTPGQPCEIAVRVTDPAGNFDWRDSQAMMWGRYALPLSHGFGGVSGGVRLVVCDRVQVADLYLQNTPQITTANAIITVRNTTGAPARRDVVVTVADRADPSRVVFRSTPREVVLSPGETQLCTRIDAPSAQPWDLEHPQLYVCTATLRAGGEESDSTRQTFGFRWFAPDGLGQDAVLRLNGKRIVLRTSISWGFWPVNGLFPSPELAERQVRVAKELGLNMLNFHRAIGHPVVLNQADEIGLLYFEEPGAYKSVGRDPFGRQLAREKLLRMVKRDRSHPSLVIYNLINEWDSRNPNPNPEEIAQHRDDMAAAHDVDPSRLILHTSAWARGVDIEDPAKLHFRPFESKPYLTGWYDVHHAGGPATWNESLYRSPTDFYGLTDDRREVVFWGEEGAISTPPRLALIKAELAKAPRLGWDGAMYLEWYDTFERFLAEKHLKPAFADVDALTKAMGAVSHLHQGRRIENMRMSNVGDGYAINGWEAEIIENHSGIVDCFRNPKADPSILAYYNQPLYVAVKVRNTVLQPPARLVADFYAVNEKNLRGPHRLVATVRDAKGRELARAERSADVLGGETYGQLMAEGVAFDVPAATVGALRVEAALVAADGAVKAQGHDDAVAVDWRGDVIRGNGAVWETENRIQRFLTDEKRISAPTFSPSLPRLDWIAVARAPSEGEPMPIPASRLQLPADAPAVSTGGVRVSIFGDQRFANPPLLERTEAKIAYSVDDGAAPDPALAVMTNYGVRWTARLTAPRTGTYVFVLRASGAAWLMIDGRMVVESTPSKNPEARRGSVTLTAERPVDLVLELRHWRGAARCDLSWIAPDTDPTIAPAILERVQRDGTTLVLLERAESWMPLVTGAANPGVAYRGSFRVGKAWLGGIHFVREHPLFTGLPVNAAMDWPYQAVVRNGDERLGLNLDGEELAAGCYHSYPMHLGTAVGVIPFGRGRIVFSTLDICSNLAAPEGPADVARKLLANFLNYRPDAPAP